MQRWDRDLPATLDDIVAMLHRRIEVHRLWAAFIRNSPDDARAAVDAGVGTYETHETYAKQYEAAIKVIICS